MTKAHKSNHSKAVDSELYVFHSEMNTVYHVRPSILAPTEGRDSLIKNFEMYGTHMRKEHYLCTQASSACPYGQRCRDIHLVPGVDASTLPTNPVHRNLESNEPEYVAYKRHEAGHVVPVFDHRTRQTYEVPSDKILVTSGSKEYLSRPDGSTGPRMQQCTHFQRKHCLRGDTCCFIHVVDGGIPKNDGRPLQNSQSPAEVTKPSTLSNETKCNQTTTSPTTTNGLFAVFTGTSDISTNSVEDVSRSVPFNSNSSSYSQYTPIAPQPMMYVMPTMPSMSSSSMSTPSHFTLMPPTPAGGVIGGGFGAFMNPMNPMTQMPQGNPMTQMTQMPQGNHMTQMQPMMPGIPSSVLNYHKPPQPAGLSYVMPNATYVIVPQNIIRI
eukprot:PhF_6_TR34180/c1_g1_i1/m.50027